MPRIFFFILIVLLLESCLDPVPSQLGIVTEEVIFTSGERMVITGRILSTEPVDVIDHGFLASSDENFSNPFKVSLGERITPGRFVGEYDNFAIDQTYYVKSFLEYSEGIIEGNVLESATKLPRIDGFEPRIASENSRLLISGSNLTKDSKVFFGERELNVLVRSDESFISVSVPPIGDTKFEEVSVEMNGERFAASYPFEYITGIWEEEEEFPNEDNYLNGIGLNVDGKVILGLGAWNGFGPYRSDLFIYDIETKTWEEQIFFDSALGHVFSCEGYFGSGSNSFVRPTDQSYTLSDKFYQYKDGTTEFVGILPFRLLDASCEKIDNQLYVFGGLTEEKQYNDKLYIYDIDDEDWTEKTILPDDINTDRTLPSFVYQGNFYFLSTDAILYQYDIGANAISEISTFPSTISEGGCAEVIEDKLYIGVFKNKRVIFEYDLIGNTWKEKTGFLGSVRDGVITSWTDGEKVFLFKNGHESKEKTRMWSFSPNEF